MMTWRDGLDISSWLMTIVFGGYALKQGQKAEDANHREQAVRRLLHFRNGTRLLRNIGQSAVSFHSSLGVNGRSAISKDALALTSELTRALSFLEDTFKIEVRAQVESARTSLGTIIRLLRGSRTEQLRDRERQEIDQLCFDAVLNLQAATGQFEKDEELGI